jgi:hypothetical protein
MNRRDIILWTLVFTVVLTVLAVLAAALGFIQSEQAALLAKWGMVGVLGEIIALFVYVSKWTLRERKPSLILVAPRIPPSLRHLDIARIDWSRDSCYIVFGSVRERIQLIPDPIGSAFRVQIPDGVMEKLKDDDVLELQLLDTKGNSWHVRPFLLFQSQLSLSTHAKIDKIISDYGDEGA